MRYALVLFGSAAALAGAGRGVAAVPLVDGCIRTGAGARPLLLRVGSFTANAVILGHGRRGAVLANQSDRDLCSWKPLAARLERGGFRVLLFDYSGADPQDDVAVGVAALRGRGVRAVALVGASKGARSVLVAAGERPASVSAVVSLSSETTSLPGAPRIEPFVRRLQARVLFVAARQDPWTGDGTETHELFAAAPKTLRQLVEVVGSDHGVDLLAGQHGARLSALVESFLARSTR